jgi:hypothetical protein
MVDRQSLLSVVVRCIFMIGLLSGSLIVWHVVDQLFIFCGLGVHSILTTVEAHMI